jgi:hypothetical protein
MDFAGKAFLKLLGQGSLIKSNPFSPLPRFVLPLAPKASHEPGTGEVNAASTPHAFSTRSGRPFSASLNSARLVSEHQACLLNPSPLERRSVAKRPFTQAILITDEQGQELDRVAFVEAIPASLRQRLQ